MPVLDLRATTSAIARNNAWDEILRKYQPAPVGDETFEVRVVTDPLPAGLVWKVRVRDLYVLNPNTGLAPPYGAAFALEPRDLGNPEAMPEHAVASLKAENNPKPTAPQVADRRAVIGTLRAAVLISEAARFGLVRRLLEPVIYNKPGYRLTSGVLDVLVKKYSSVMEWRSGPEPNAWQMNAALRTTLSLGDIRTFAGSENQPYGAGLKGIAELFKLIGEPFLAS